MRRSVSLVAGLVCLLFVAACSPGAAQPQPPAHPMGPGCTWPADLDPQRDGSAVLAVAAPDYTTVLVLLDVATGGVRARCSGLELRGGAAALQEGSGLGRAVPTASVLFPSVSPDWRWALSSAGAVELATGRVVAEPGPGWRATALPGEGRVLRERVAAGSSRPEDDYVAANWCVAPRLDAPENECQVLAGDRPGFPAVGRDGTVAWAPATAVPVQLDRLSGVLQTDGSRIVQLRLSRDLWDHRAVVDASGRAGLIGPDEFRFAPGNIGFEDHPGWYTIEEIGAAGAAARLHTGLSSWSEVRALEGGLQVMPFGAMVVEGGRAVVAALRATDAAVFVRIAEDAPARVVTRLPLGGGPALEGGVRQVFGWPGTASPVEP